MIKTSYNSKKKKSKIDRPKSRLEIAKANRLKKVKHDGIFKKLRSNKKVRKALLIIGGVILLSLTVSGVYAMAWLQRLDSEIPTPDKVFATDLHIATDIYDRHELDGAGKGTLLYKVIGNVNSDKVDIKDIPEVLKASFLAAEDDNFYNHHGYDPQAIIRCAINTLRHTDVCGASTITQQLIKLTTRDEQATLQTKIKELFLAIKVEDNYSKDAILEMYLRITAFGSNVVGAQTAAQFYFGKNVKDLDLAQAAIIAAIVRNPAALSPTKPYNGDVTAAQKAVKDRQGFIFDQMTQKLALINSELKKNKGLSETDPDIITQDMIDKARKETLTYRPPIATDKKAGHFVDYVINELTSKPYNNGEPFDIPTLQNGGYKIYTSLDYGLQQIAEKWTLKGGNDYAYLNMHNAALMTTQPSTGQILTMVGSKSYTGTSEACDARGQNCKYDPQVNVLLSPQSPGSTNKPLGYYEAFKEGKLFPGSVLPDIPINIGSYDPKDWDGKFLGPHYDARDVLRLSRNIPALEVAEAIGVDNYIKTAKSFGYTTYDNGDFGDSLILGGGDVIPVEHAQAYGVFANGGDLVKLNPIMKIVDKDGKTVYEAKPERKQVGDPQGIWLLNQSLYRLDSLGTQIFWDDRDIAGKTGTTEENKHAWVVMYSPDFVTIAIGGNNNNDPLNQNAGWPGTLVVPWVKNYMREISGSPFISPKTKFQRPGYVYRGGGDCDSNGQCEGLYGDWLIQGREPPRGDFQKKQVVVCSDEQNKLARDIDKKMGLTVTKEFLYYRMPTANWQHFLDDYMKKKGTPNGGPTDSCDINRTGGANGPFFNTSNPLAGSFVNVSSTIKIHITGGAFSTTGNVNGVSFSLDSVSLGGACTTTTYSAIDITCDVPASLSSGAHTLGGTITDDAGKSGTYTKNVNFDSGLSLSPPPSSLTWGQNVGAACSSGTCSYNITVSYNQAWPIAPNSVELFVSKNGGAATLLGTITPPSGTVNWGDVITKPTPPGSQDTYVFYARATTSTGGTLQSGNYTVVVN